VTHKKVGAKPVWRSADIPRRAGRHGIVSLKRCRPDDFAATGSAWAQEPRRIVNGVLRHGGQMSATWRRGDEDSGAFQQEAIWQTSSIMATRGIAAGPM